MRRKAGLVRLGAQGTFDSFNIVVAGVKGAPEQGIGLIYETLTTASLDEPSAAYGLLAEAVFLSLPISVGHLPPAAGGALARRPAGHGGRRDLLLRDPQGEQPDLRVLLQERRRRRKRLGEREVTFTFDEAGNRELPQIIGQLPILPKHWWEGTAPDGRKRDVTQTTLEPPLGSGPYRLKSFEAGRTAVLRAGARLLGRAIST